MTTTNRRSDIRKALATMIAAVPTTAYAAFGVSTLAHIKGAALRQADQAWGHLAFSVSPVDTGFGDGRGRDARTVHTSYSVQIEFQTKAGFDGLGEWTDLDLANDLAEDVTTALCVDGQQAFSVVPTLVRVSLPNEAGIVLIEIRIDAHHHFAV